MGLLAGPPCRINW